MWGTGAPRREFLHADDLADAALHLMRHYDDEEIINVGTGDDLSIDELAALIGRVVGYRGRIRFDAGKPDGAPRKLLDVTKIRTTGWAPRIPLEIGIRETYKWYVSAQGVKPRPLQNAAQ